MNPADPTLPVPVAIIGMGCMFPGAKDLAGYWSNVRNRRDAITDVPDSHWRPADYFDGDPTSADRTYARRGGFIPPVDFPPLEFGIAPNNLEATDTTQLLGLMVARQALEDAGYGEGSTRPLDRDRVSVILGVTGALELVIPLGARLGHPIWRRALAASGVPHDTAEEVVRRIADSYVGWQENSFPGLLGNVAAGRIANRLDLGGTNCVIDAACASSLGALELAMLELAAGRCDLALTGGLDTFNDIFMYMCFSKTPALSPRGDARPFDAGCDGTILGEGLGVIALKRLDDARRDGDRIYAVIRSVGSSSDGKGNAVYAPSAAGQVKALRRAYRLAEVPPGTVELVEAHGTGTKVGDATELSALNEVYRDSRAEGTWCALGSVKSQIGHTKAAAGAAGLIKAALALHHQVLPPTIKVERPIEGVGPGESPFYVNTEARPWLPRSGHPRRAAVSAFGFGGSNFHCVLEEAEEAAPRADWDGDVQIVAFSARDREGLRKALEAWPRALDWADLRLEAVRSRAAFRPDDSERLLFVIDRATGQEAMLEDAVATLAGAPAKQGVFLGAGPRPGRLAMLFPGQGSQYPGMLRELACLFPEMRATLAEADALVDPDSPRTSDHIYPFPAFNAEVRAGQESALRATDVAQPALGAVSLGLFRILERFGVRPDVTAGHSFGELTALCAAGWIDAGAFARLARERGRLMAAESRDSRGAMLAVPASAALVEETIREERLDLVIANRNAPRQVVLSGSIDEVARAVSAFEARKIATRRLDVSAAFHSPSVAAASAPFLELLRNIPVIPTEMPVYSNTTARPYPADPDEARALLAGQIAQPVEFVDEVEEMIRSGVATFLEVGPGNVLSGLVRSIVEGSDLTPRVLALDSSRGARGNLLELASTLAGLAALGYAVDLTRWDETGAAMPPLRKPALTVKLCGANLGPRTPASIEHATDSPRAQPAAASRDKIPPIPPIQPTSPSPSTHRGSPREGHSVGTNGDGTAVSNGKHMEHANANGTARTRLVPIGSNDPGLLAQALRDAQENLVALQKLGAQTAELHRQFLEGQDKAQRTFQSLLERQQRLTLATLGLETVLPARPASSHRSDAAPPSVALREPDLSREFRSSIPTPPRLEEDRAEPLTAAEPPSEARQAAVELLEVVSEKTGYPIEMLELDMRLDADLGIDSIKRVEILSAIQERRPGAPTITPENLGTLQTLREIAAFLDSGEQTPISARSAVPSDADSIQSVLLGVVSEKTGYPTEMLELEMRLDADLGIDSIKRVEILSALQERLPAAPAIEPEHVGALNTLQEMVDFLDGRGREKTAARPRDVEALLLEVVSAKTGYPVEMLEPTMRLDADPGIDSIKRVEILSSLQERLPDAPAIAPEHLGSLQTLRDVVEHLVGVPLGSEITNGSFHDHSIGVSAASRLQRLVLESVKLEATEPVEGLIRPEDHVWVLDDGDGLAAALVERFTARGSSARLIARGEVGSIEAPERLDALVLVGSTMARDGSIEDAFRLLRAAGPRLRSARNETRALLATVSRLDGAFGAGDLATGAETLTGALAGLAKTAAHEWPEVRCKAIDLDHALGSAAEAVDLVFDELFRLEPMEVGLSRRGRTSLDLRARPLVASGREAPIEPGEVVVVSGGARGVTAEVAVALAKAFRPTLILLGRRPAPDREPDRLVPLESEAEIKRALAARANGQATPQRIGERFREVETGRAIRATLARIEASGARVEYHQVDVRDADEVRKVLDRVRAEHGPVRGLIHGAGVLADRRIVDQTDEQFADVFDTKVAGLRALLDGARDDELKLLVLFSSTTARFGRVGQAAYAAANEALNKSARHEARRRPNCRVRSLEWGPWKGGMVTSSLEQLFASEGIGLIPLEAGAKFVVDELLAARPGDRAVEVVVLGEGTIPKPISSRGTHSTPSARLSTLTTVFERPLDALALPILRSHVIDGRGVVPMALLLEWMAQGAVQRHPGLAFLGLDDMRLLKGAIAHDDQPETLAVLVGKAARDGGSYRIPVEVRGIKGDGASLTHARGDVLLAEIAPRGSPRPPIDAATLQLPTYDRSVRSVYEDVLFHGPDLHSIERIDGLGEAGYIASARTGAAPGSWIERPLRQGWLSDPLALDSAFQLMSLWSFERALGPSLPTMVGRYRQFRPAFPTGRVSIVARVSRPAPNRETADIDFVDLDGNLVASIEMYECVSVASLNQSFRRNRLPRTRVAPGAR